MGSKERERRERGRRAALNERTGISDRYTKSAMAMI